MKLSDDRKDICVGVLGLFFGGHGRNYSTPEIYGVIITFFYIKGIAVNNRLTACLIIAYHYIMEFAYYFWFYFVGLASSAELYVSAISVLDDPQQLLWQEPSGASSALVVALTVFAEASGLSTDDGYNGLPSASWLAENSDVQVLNRLNEALRVAEPVEPSSCILGDLMNHDLPVAHVDAPCLVVYDIPQAKLLPGAVCMVDAKLKTVSGPVMSSAGGISISLVPSGGGSSNIGGGPTFTDVKDLDNSDDDYDVQIIGVTPAMSPPKTSYDVGGVGGSGKLSLPSRDATDPAGGNEVGAVVQCVVLPCTAQYVSCFLPTAHGERVFVATAPLSADVRLNEAWQRHGGTTSAADSPAHLFVFNVVMNTGVVMLEDTPHLSAAVSDADDAVMSASLLPADVGQADEYDSNNSEQTSAVVATTRCGNIQIISLADLSVLCSISGDRYKSAVYCCSIDRLCASTADSRLCFFTIGKSDADADGELDDVDTLMSVVADDVKSSSDASLSSSSPAVKSAAARHRLGISLKLHVSELFVCDVHGPQLSVPSVHHRSAGTSQSTSTHRQLRSILPSWSDSRTLGIKYTFIRLEYIRLEQFINN